MLGRAAGRALREHGAMAVGLGGLENLQLRGSTRFAELWTSLALQQCVMWFDNYPHSRPHGGQDVLATSRPQGPVSPGCCPTDTRSSSRC